MPSSNEIMDKMNTSGIKWLNLQFIDIFGSVREVSVNRELTAASDLDKGIEVDNIGNVFNDDYYEKLILIPDLDTYVDMGDRNARFICRIQKTDGTRYLKDPIYATDRLGKNADALGMGKIVMRQRVEFYVFDRYGVDRTYKEGGSAVTLGSKESKWTPNAPILENMNVTSFPNDLYNGIRQQICQVYSQFGYAVERHMHGRNSSSHQAMFIKDLDFITSAYAFTSFKQVARTVGFLNGVNATFMPMPIPSEKGSGLELEISAIGDKGESVFYDKKDGLSENARYFVGGVLEHLKAIMLFTNPTTNSYKRFYEEPRYASWGNADKSNAIFIDTSGKETRIVATFPDPMLNPFIAYPVIMAAGLDGVKKKTEPPMEMLTERPSTMPVKERKRLKVEEFPRELMVAIEAMESDVDFVKGVITPELLVDYLEQKLKEQRMGSMIPNAYEFDQYFHL
jgi:glutamine synthetase